jgi:hypothetical protein
MKTANKNFAKVQPVGVEMFHTDRQGKKTDMTKLLMAFENFVYGAKIF